MMKIESRESGLYLQSELLVPDRVERVGDDAGRLDVLGRQEVSNSSLLLQREPAHRACGSLLTRALR